VAFGEGPLSFPPLVEAAETLFVPVAIRNNVEGYEQQVLERYDEPAWNNPVVRFLDARGADLIARRDGVYDLGGVAGRMVAALDAAGRPVPGWFAAAVADAGGGEVAVADFAMF